MLIGRLVATIHDCCAKKNSAMFARKTVNSLPQKESGKLLTPKMAQWLFCFAVHEYKYGKLNIIKNQEERFFGTISVFLTCCELKTKWLFSEIYQKNIC